MTEQEAITAKLKQMLGELQFQLALLAAKCDVLMAENLALKAPKADG